MTKISFKGQSEFNVLYFSDIHANSSKLKYFKSGVDEFDALYKGKNNLKLACGDIHFASDIEPNVLITKFMNLIGLDASSVGNHEIEGGDYWAKSLELANPLFKFVSANLSFSRPNKMEDKIVKSTIVERNSEKIGIIGLTAFDSEELMFRNSSNDYVKVNNYKKSVQAVKNEIKKLEKEGINKIFLLAHTGAKSKRGFEYYKNLANIGGIDLIIGGHDHHQRDEWFLTERGEPVKILQSEAANDTNKESQDLGRFGIFNASFDENGVLIPSESHNTFKSTLNYPASIEIEALEDEILQNNKVIGSTEQNFECKYRKTKENPNANLLADAMLWIARTTRPQSNVQISLLNSGEIKDDIPTGDISIKDIKKAFPFTHNVTIVETKLTKKQIFEALNWGVTTTTFPKQTLGIVQVGGLKYTIGKDNKVKDVYLLDQEGRLGECLDFVDPAKEYCVVYDTFLLQGSGGMNALKKNLSSPDVYIYPYHHQNALIEYIKYLSEKPIEVKMGRIIIE